MQNVAKTRTQRRLEKRQAVLLLVLVLVVSLCSFVLGVMVGRRGAERDLATQLREQQETFRIVQAPAAPVAAPAPAAEQAASEEPPAEAASESPRLSFYDDLARDSLPQGSGINQQPRKPEPAEPAARVQPPLVLPDQPIVVRDPAAQTVTVATVAAPAEQAAAPAAILLPQVSAQGTHAVQIGSFGSVNEAAALRQVMLDKGYPAFLAEADLGERGLWYRVRIGPYRDAATAGIAQQVLHEKETIEGFVTRLAP